MFKVTKYLINVTVSAIQVIIHGLCILYQDHYFEEI